MRLLFLFLTLAFAQVKAQVEVFRGDIDTSNYIKPEDTITCAPAYGDGDPDFLNYIESHFNMLITSSSFDLAGDVVRLSFIVEKNGKLDDYKTLSFSNANIASELERVIVSMPEWKPGYERGRKKSTLMVYELKIRKVTDQVNRIQVLINDNTIEYSDKTKAVKWFLVGGSLIVMVLLITRGFNL